MVSVRDGAICICWAIGLGRDGMERRELTLVLTICNLLGLADGLSPAETNATKDVQNNISTMAVAPASVIGYGT